MSTRPRGWRAAAVAVALAVSIAGCTSGGSSAQRSPSPAPTPTPSATTPVAQQLQQLAGRGTHARFRATYVVRSQHPKAHATWLVWRSANSLRVDVVTKRATATLIRTPKATYSCRKAKHRRTCFRVAKAGKPIPPLFRLLAHTLFSSDVATLAGALNGYDVVVVTPATVGLSGSVGLCFRVTPTTKKATLHKAVYCLDDKGVITAVRYPNGNLVRRTHLVMKAPRAKAFVPYSKPTPLPS